MKILNQLSLFGLCVGLAITTLSSQPIQAQTFSPRELIEMQLQQQRQRGVNPQSGYHALPKPAVASVTPQSLAQTLAKWPSIAGPFEVLPFRDGFSINGERILDPEGKMVKYALDSQTGDYAYMTQTTPTTFSIKLARHKAGSPVLVATATRHAGAWMVETATGERLNGAQLVLHPRGLIVARDSALFQWTAGSAIQSHAVPESFNLAAHQNGDIAGTQWVLLEKLKEDKQQEGGILAGTPFGELLGSAKRIGTILGVNASDSDYALFNLANGQMVSLGLSMEEKTAHFMSLCRTRNVWVAQCEQMDSMDSLFMQDGGANRTHYFWRVSWHRTGQGTVAVVMENGISKISAINLNTNQRARVFERALGIGNWSARQTANGAIRVDAQLGLDRGVQEDVRQLFSSASASPVETKAAQ